MPKYNYVAVDTKGKEITGVLESDNRTSAASRIREMGYFPTNVIEADKDKRGGPSAAKAAAGAAKPKGKSLSSLNIKLPDTGRVKTKILTAFTRQLATLIDAGLPL